MIIKIECIKQIIGFLIALGKPVEVKAIFNKLQYRRKFERFVLDVARPCPGRNDQQRYARSESEIVDSRRRHMIVEAAKVVPRQEDYCKKNWHASPLEEQKAISLASQPVLLERPIKSASHGVVPESLRRFRKRQPDVMLELHAMRSLLQIEGVRSGRLDAGFVFSSTRMNGDL